MDDFPTKTSIYKGFSMAMLKNKMVFPDFQENQLFTIHDQLALDRAMEDRLKSTGIMPMHRDGVLLNLYITHIFIINVYLYDICMCIYIHIYIYLFIYRYVPEVSNWIWKIGQWKDRMFDS